MINFLHIFYSLGERRVRDEDSKSSASTLDANISPLRESPVDISIGDSLMNAVENKVVHAPSKNPFDDDYDEEKNPFYEDSFRDEQSDDDGYDKRLNPFAS